MPRDAQVFRLNAIRLLEQAGESADPVEIASLCQQASGWAAVCVSAELSDIRNDVLGIKGALEDFDGHGAGVHLHYISDYLEKLADRR